jgi:hypothetical protein
VRLRSSAFPAIWISVCPRLEGLFATLPSLSVGYWRLVKEDRTVAVVPALEVLLALQDTAAPVLDTVELPTTTVLRRTAS